MMAKWLRIRALLLQEVFLTRRAFEMFVDLIVFPIMNVVLFGLITNFLGASGNHANAQVLIAGILLWEVVTIYQYNVTVGSLWSIWSHNLTNIFIAPVSMAEYLMAGALAALVRTFVTVGLLAVGTYFLFGFNLLHLGVLNTLLFFSNLSLFAWWFGVILLGIIFRFGTRVQALAWGAVFLIQPLVAAFFPVSVLPHGLQFVAHAFPATYVFEAAREALHHPGVDMGYLAITTGLNLGYALLSALIFKRLFYRSRASGQFARNDL